jgi:putative ABC transport system substrate-binding protein
MKRRDFIGLLGGAFALPLSGNAEEQGMPMIGFLSSRSPDDSAPHLAACLEGLKAFGYVDGRTASIVYRWASGDYERLPTLANEIVSLHPAVIIAGGGIPSARAAGTATSSIPVLFIGGDPVVAGLVTSLNRPTGNITGVSILSGELGGKRLELLTQLVPPAEVIGLLTNPQDRGDADAQIKDVQIAARILGRRLVVVGASTGPDLDKSFSVAVDSGVTALVVQNDPFFDTVRAQMIALAARYRLPTIYHIREFPAGGGLMSYGPSLADAYRQAGILAGRVLKGTKVTDLPVVQPTKFELVINLRTAAALGLTVPPTLLAQADEVIE